MSTADRWDIVDNDFKYGVIFILVLVLIFVFLSSTRVKKNDIRDLMEDKLIDDFNVVSSYLEGEDYTREEALDAFNTIEEELNKLY